MDWHPIADLLWRLGVITENERAIKRQLTINQIRAGFDLPPIDDRLEIVIRNADPGGANEEGK